MERLTVLMPARNAATTVATALMSVLRGIPDDARVLVLDDASEDGTGDVVARISRRDSRVGLIRSNTASGVPKALNALIEASDTPLIARMDADDIALPWRFVSQLRALDRRSLDMVFAPAIMYGPSRLAFLPQPPIVAGPSATPYELLLTCTLIHPTLVGRRAAIVAAGGYRCLPAEDWDLFMRMALSGDRLARIALHGILYRRHAGQVTAKEAWHTAVAIDPGTAAIHEELCRTLVGCGQGAYAALTGPGADVRELNAALELLDEVWKVAGSFPLSDLIGVRTNVLAAKRLIKARYPANFDGRKVRRWIRSNIPI